MLSFARRCKARFYFEATDDPELCAEVFDD